MRTPQIRADACHQRVVLWLQLAGDGLARQDASGAALTAPVRGGVVTSAAKRHVVCVFEQQHGLVALRQSAEHGGAFVRCGTVAHYVVVPRAGDAQRRLLNQGKGLRRNTRLTYTWMTGVSRYKYY